MVQAWYMDDSSEDQRTPHKIEPSQDVSRECACLYVVRAGRLSQLLRKVSLDELKQIGVLYWHIPVAEMDV